GSVSGGGVSGSVASMGRRSFAENTQDAFRYSPFAIRGSGRQDSHVFCEKRKANCEERSGVSIVKPRLGRVRVTADFPEPFVIAGEELDLPDPLRALPRVELRRDHPAWSAVFERQRFSLPRV